MKTLTKTLTRNDYTQIHNLINKAKLNLINRLDILSQMDRLIKTQIDREVKLHFVRDMKKLLKEKASNY